MITDAERQALEWADHYRETTNHQHPREALDTLAAAVRRLEAENERLQDAYDQLTGEKFSDRCHVVLRQRAEAAEKRCSKYTAEIAALHEVLDELRAKLTAAEEAKKEAVKILLWVIGEHNAPHDCYSTGPFHGDARDMMCPACFALAKYEGEVK